MKRNAWAGINPDHKKGIVELIKAAARPYMREEQRAELLFRNPAFKRELQKVERLVAKARKVRGTSNRNGRDYVFEWHKSKALLQYWRLCDRWQISYKWNLNKDALPQSVFMKPRLLYDNLAMDLLDPEIAPYPGTGVPQYLYLRIEPWTKLEDVKVIWRRVEELKKTIFGYSDRDKDSFGNTLCWFDLHKLYGLSFLKIARLWIQEAAPYIRDEESFKITVRQGIKRIKRYIERLTPAKDPVASPKK